MNKTLDIIREVFGSASPGVVDGFRSTRSPRQIERERVRQMLEQERYEVWCKPERGDLYEPECEWPTKINKRMTLTRLYENENAEYVFCAVPGGSTQDVSEDFARAMVRDMHDNGHDFHTMTSLPQFISKHLTWDEVFGEIAE